MRAARRALLSAIERWTFRHSARITVPSSAFAPVVHALAPGAPVTVVPNWSRSGRHAGARSRSRADRDAPAQAMRPRLGWRDRFVVAHTGNMGLKQGLEDLARAAAPPVGGAAERAGVVHR